MSGWLQKVRITQAPYRGVIGHLSFNKEGEPWITFQDPGLQWIHVPADGTEEPIGDPFEAGIVSGYTEDGEWKGDEPEKWYELRVTFDVRLTAQSPMEAQQLAAELVDQNDWIDGRGSWDIRKIEILDSRTKEEE